MNSVQDLERYADAGTDARGPGRSVPSVAAACRILAALARPGREGLTLSELARDLELSKSSAHGLLATLVAEGLVQRHADSRRYRLGATLVALGHAAGRQARTAAVAVERLQPLASEHGLTFALAQVADFGDAQIVERAYPLDAVHVGIALGSRYGLFDGAVGKCLLAALAPEECERRVRGAEIPRHTDRTIVDPERLLREVEQVRRDGWAASTQELKENHAVAASLRGPAGELEYVLVAVGFPGQLAEERIAAVGEVLRDTAHAVERALGAPDSVDERGTRWPA